MLGPIWTGAIIVLALITLALAIAGGSGTWIIVAACFLIFGVGMAWHENRFSPRRMRRP
jgi:hypothetical protein